MRTNAALTAIYHVYSLFIYNITSTINLSNFQDKFPYFFDFDFFVVGFSGFPSNSFSISAALLSTTLIIS